MKNQKNSKNSTPEEIKLESSHSAQTERMNQFKGDRTSTDKMGDKRYE